VREAPTGNKAFRVALQELERYHAGADRQCPCPRDDREIHCRPLSKQRYRAARRWPMLHPGSIHYLMPVIVQYNWSREAGPTTESNARRELAAARDVRVHSGYATASPTDLNWPLHLEKAGLRTGVAGKHGQPEIRGYSKDSGGFQSGDVESDQRSSAGAKESTARPAAQIAAHH